MRLPAAVPLAGIQWAETETALVQVISQLNASLPTNADKALTWYQQWSTSTAHLLTFQLDSATVDQFVLTRRHWALMAMDLTATEEARWAMLHAEKDERLLAFASLLQELRALREHVSTYHELVVLDTNVYLHHEAYFDGTDWRPMIPHLAGGRFLVVLPIVVVRELDRKKIDAKNVTVSETNKELLRTRARGTARKIGELFPTPDSTARLRAEDQKADINLLLDDRRHRPVGDADAELRDRALSLQAATGRRVTLLTRDNNMRFQAQIEGLEVVDVSK